MAHLINTRIAVFWPAEKAWFAGKVTKYDAKETAHHIVYDDGNLEWRDLKQFKWRKEKKKAAKKKKKDATKDATTDATKDATKDVTGRVRLTRAAKTNFVKRFNQEVPKDNRTEEIIALRAKLAEVDPKPSNEAELVAFLNPRIKADGYWIKESKLPGAGYGLFTLKARKVGGDGPVYCGEIQKGIPSPDKDR